MSDQTTEAETRLLAYLANDPFSGPWPLDADIHALIAEVRALRAEREAFITEALDNDRVADLMRSLVTAGRNRMNLGTALAYWPPFERFTRVATPTEAVP